MLWDVDYTLVGADGLGTRLYEVVFREMFGRELTEVAPKAGRTDRAIVGDTLALAGVARAEVDAFLAALARVAADGAVPGPVWPLPGAAEAIAALAAAGIRQSVLTGNVRPLADLKLRRAGLGEHLDLGTGGTAGRRWLGAHNGQSDESQLSSPWSERQTGVVRDAAEVPGSSVARRAASLARVLISA